MDPISAALTDSLAAFDEAHEPTEPQFDDSGAPMYPGEPFVVDNDRKATWAMRKLHDHKQQVDGIIAVAEAEIARIQQWADEEATKHAHAIAYFEAQLTRYARQVREESDGKVKTVSTPYGVVKSRAGQPKWQVDSEALVPWLRETHPEWVRTVTTESPDLMALKGALEVAETDSMGTVALDEGGVIVPGIEILPATVTYTVEVAK